MSPRVTRRRSEEQTRISQQRTVYVGGAILVLILFASWLPRPCPFLRSAFGTCPVDSTYVSAPVAGTEGYDINRIPNQIIDQNLSEFKVTANPQRANAEITFRYRGDAAKSIAYLALRTSEGGSLTPGSEIRNGNTSGSGIERIALITHPLLASLDWARYSTVLPTTTLYQRNETYTDPIELRNNPPKSNILAMDSVIAKRWGFRVGTYVSLDDLKSLDGIDYIVTSYSSPIPDGGWSVFRQAIDASSGFVDQQNELSWYMFTNTDKRAETPFRTSTITIDYRQPNREE
jgi:hypothetical protein